MSSTAHLYRRWEQARRDCLRWYRHLRYDQIVAAALLLILGSATEPLACLFHCKQHAFSHAPHDSGRQQEHHHGADVSSSTPVEQTPQTPGIPLSIPSSIVGQAAPSLPDTLGFEREGGCHDGADAAARAGNNLTTFELEHEHLAAASIAAQVPVSLFVQTHFHGVRAWRPPAALHPPLRPPIL